MRRWWRAHQNRTAYDTQSRLRKLSSLNYFHLTKSFRKKKSPPIMSQLNSSQEGRMEAKNFVVFRDEGIFNRKSIFQFIMLLTLLFQLLPRLNRSRLRAFLVFPLSAAKANMLGWGKMFSVPLCINLEVKYNQTFLLRQFFTSLAFLLLSIFNIDFFFMNFKTFSNLFVAGGNLWLSSSFFTFLLFSSRSDGGIYELVDNSWNFDATKICFEISNGVLRAASISRLIKDDEDGTTFIIHNNESATIIEVISNIDAQRKIFSQVGAN